ncbi:diguanylate cyclase [filamentous cyanobacterium LEGE 11480]|uniref:Diguanylate cyclase n=1 Tax=Romeriopsis navalis LEGE 11480 TaxID=2777977 RepID=A0A928VV24_9CYAN|nr:diguanylate cyclase [Romeriopsis navalis]MBE9033115.1 diguanylate cyclase [Romeriopsis navalis LEGE 11480]
MEPSWAQTLYNWIGTTLAQVNPIKSHSLTLKTLINMSLRVALVVIGSAMLSYFYLLGQTEIQVKEQLSKYVTERGKLEAEIFQLAMDRHQILKQAILNTTPTIPNPPLRLHRWRDGTQRNFPDRQPLEEFDGEHQAAIFWGKQPITTARRQQLTRLAQLTTQYGQAWRDRFTNTYIITPDNAAIVYWPEVPGPLIVPGDFDVHDGVFFYASDQQHDPERKTVWTGVYHDPASPDWIVSVVTPVDQPNGQHIATIGHDIILTDLMQRTLSDRLNGSYNLIFSADGQLIVHPDFGEDIQAKNGELTVQTINQPHLNHIYQRVTQSAAQPPALLNNVIENPEDHEFLAIAPLVGPNWYFVTVYPKTLLSQAAISAAKFVMLSGLVSLLVEMTLLYRVLHQQVGHPLAELASATQQVASGDFNFTIQNDRPDEIGELAKSFTHMSKQLQDLFNNLETRIQSRTAELEAANQELEILSTLDGLTQIANRRQFDTYLEQEYQRQRRTQQPLALIMLDVDYFKRYNDHYGHLRGDECLKQVAQVLQQVVKRPTDLVARYGGEEFVIVLPLTDTAGAIVIAETVQQTLAASQYAHQASEISDYLTLSIGIAAVPQIPTEQATDLVATADQCLYQAKQQGRDRWIYWNDTNRQYCSSKKR